MSTDHPVLPKSPLSLNSSIAAEDLVQAYLIALGEGEEVDRVEYAQCLPDPSERRRFLIVVLAEELFHRQTKDPGIQVESFLEQLQDEDDRRELLRYVDRNRSASRLRHRALSANTRLANRYVILGEFASSGMAIAYSAFDEQLSKERSVKAIEHQDASSELVLEWEDLVRAESKRMAALGCRNISLIHDVVRAGDASYVVTDALEGCGLNDVIRAARVEREARGARSSSRKDPRWIERAVGSGVASGFEDLQVPGSWYRTVARIMERAARTLDLAHGVHVQHGDLNPSNILLVRGGEPILLGLGSGSNSPARASELEAKRLRMPEYMAPEQFRSTGQGGAVHSDIYQLGVVLYEFLTLCCPYRNDAPEFIHDMLAGVFVAPRVIDPRLPAALEAICQKAMAKDIHERYGSPRELADDLECFTRGRPPQYADLSTLGKLGMWARRFTH